jgi:hypothetical protein
MPEHNVDPIKSYLHSRSAENRTILNLKSFHGSPPMCVSKAENTPNTATCSFLEVVGELLGDCAYRDQPRPEVLVTGPNPAANAVLS